MNYHPIIDRLKQIVSLLGNIDPGGGTITDGIVFTSVDANGYPLTADYYCSDGEIPTKMFFPGYAASSYNYLTTGMWRNMTSLTIKNPITTLNESCFVAFHGDIVGDFSGVTSMPGQQNTSANGTNVFSNSRITEIDLDNCTYFTGANFNSCSYLKRVHAPKCNAIWCKWDAGASRATFGKCTALETVHLGSVGTECLLQNNQIFSGCTQSGLTITLYCSGTNVDTQVSNIRNGATNATIIIKASENTTYNNVSYSAGDTILTSEVTP